jgi:NAD(P)-dependent dehydrogenase (short-subunit alcohol dehydrogenase family)
MSLSKINLKLNLTLKSVVEKSNYQVGMYEGYKMSKNGLNALTREQQKLVDINEKNILISAVHPGEVITDMNPGGNISAEKCNNFISE